MIVNNMILIPLARKKSNAQNNSFFEILAIIRDQTNFDPSSLITLVDEPLAKEVYIAIIENITMIEEDVETFLDATCESSLPSKGGIH